MTQRETQTCGQTHMHVTTIRKIPDSVLLEIFDFYRMGHDAHGFPFRPIPEWRPLVHVCKKWRHVIFASPIRLDIQLICIHGTPVKETLSVRPPLPLIVDYDTYWRSDEGKGLTPNDEDGVIATLEHSDRVRFVKMSVTCTLLGKMATAMQEPFPMLTQLWLSSEDVNMPVLPEVFLGGSAPRLRSAYLDGIPFPVFPTFLLSATDLVDLQLLNIPKTGFISQDKMVESLAGLTMLETLSIGFQSPVLDRRLRLPLPPISFPSLTNFSLRGVGEYLEDFVAHIDTPMLKTFTITYFNRLIFEIPSLSQFICRTQSLDLSRFKRARFDFGSDNAYVHLDCDQADQLGSHFTLRISCQGLDWQVAHIAQVISQCFASAMSSVDDLSISARDLLPGWEEDVDRTEWPGLLRPFTAVETLRIPMQLAEHITQNMVNNHFMALQSLLLEVEPNA